MTVYSRSDVAAISISPAHGGCGTTHSRPAPGGNPVPVWQLSCPRCEDFLRSDPLWGATSGTIPETPDELDAREHAEQRTQREQFTHNVDAMETIGRAMTELAHGQKNQSTELASALASVFGPLLAQMGITPPQDGAQTAADAPPVPDAPAVDVDAAQATLERLAAEHPDTLTALPAGPKVKPHVPDLDSMNMNELNAYAKSRGLPGRRSRAEQIEAIREHLGL